MNYSTDSSYLCAEIKKKLKERAMQDNPERFFIHDAGGMVFTSSVVAAACQRRATGHASLSN